MISKKTYIRTLPILFILIELLLSLITDRSDILSNDGSVGLSESVIYCFYVFVDIVS